MLTRPLLLTNTKPIAQNVGAQSGLSTSHRLGFWLVAQLQSLTHTVNDGIKLFVIIEHVMSHKKYVVSHALNAVIREASWSSTAPDPWITSP